VSLRDDKPSLRREFLFGLSVLAGAAVTVAVLASLIGQIIDPDIATLALVVLIAGEVLVVVLFGRHLIERLILKPMAALMHAARELATGSVEHRAPAAETREFTALADQFNEMTDRLLDVQGQLVRAEKLAGIGRLAAGVAHEIGNPLSAVGTYLEVLKQRGGDPEIIAAITRETDRIDRIVRGLLAYARPQEDQTDAVDLGSVLKSALELLGQQGTLRDNTVTFTADPAAPRVRGKAHLLEQVAVNLLLNAVDAAPGRGITAGVEAWTYDPAAPARTRSSDPHAFPRPSRGVARRPWRADLAPGTPGALLYVSDAGPGVPEADRERVFDPFYTTKPPGAGTGLGLAIVQRTVHESGGVIWVDVAREGGAAFKIFLPAEGSRA